MLQLLFSRAASVDDVKALQALFLLLISGPDELVRKEYEGKGFLSMPFGDGVNLDDLIGLINSPLAVYPGTDLAASPATTGSFKNGPTLPSHIPRIVVNAPGTDAPIDPQRLLDGFVIEVVASAESLNKLSLPLWGSSWMLTGSAKGSGNVTGRITLSQSPGGTPAVTTDTNSRSDAALTIGLGHTTAGDSFLFGDKKRTFLAIGRAEASLTLTPTLPNQAETPVFGLLLTFDKVKLGLSADVLRTIGMGLSLPDSLIASGSFRIPFLQGAGLPLEGGALAVEFPAHLGVALGGSGAGLWVDDLLTRIEFAVGNEGLAFRIVLRVSARAELGPMKATIDGAGAWLGRWSSGNAGLLPPKGIGLALEAGPISGGGFMSQMGPDEFGGALDIKILGIGAFAYGIYKRLPDGAISFVALIGVRLPPPGIQLGFGFAVSGFGGLIGINRRADLDRLREKLASGSAGDVLFTSDPTRNAPKLLGDMRELFPDEKGVHVFGPTLQLNWLSLIKLDVGVFIELPGPRKIFVAGSGRIVVGSEAFALVHLRLDFVGGVDFTQSLIFFDGVLVNSRVLGFIQITGGLALRFGYGSNAFFLFSVGGFHPSFNPGGMAVPDIPRAGAGFDLGYVWFRQQMYYAVTSNTVQFGSRTEAGVKIAVISVHGWIEFHALIQLRPFHFDAMIDVGMEARVFGRSFASIRVQGQLTGPGPLVLRAKASVKILVTISKNVTITLDTSPGEQLPVIDSLVDVILPEFTKPENVRGEGSDPEVQLAPEMTALLPTGSVVWEQKRLPLNIPVQRVDGAPVAEQSLSVTVTNMPYSHAQDLFALASFRNVSDGEKLTIPAFSDADSGVSIDLTDGVTTSPHSAAIPDEVNLIRLPQRRRFSALFATYAPGIVAGLSERATGAQVKKQEAKVVLAPETWNGGLTPAQGFILQSGVPSGPTASPQLAIEGVFQ
ncbi:hypothetical protein SAMN06298212_11937 [Ruaniaceae bacterium KH17]|nr:hypothetical protein SAMN06298212_11937 [Ruaniaceae bacterium KH17]